MFHRFCDGPTGTGIRRVEFHAFVRRLREQCDIVSMRELTRRLRQGSKAGLPLAVITVDDGYADFYSVAMPVLREFQVPATLFATAGFVDRRCWLWWDALRYSIDAHPGGATRLEVGNESVSLFLADADSREKAWQAVADLLVKRNHERMDVIDQIGRDGGVPLPELPTANYAAMSWEQLREVEAEGVEIGGHTMTHAFLPGLNSSALDAEIAGSKALTERHLGHRLQTFAYPNGMLYDHTSTVEAAVRSAGFDAAVLAFPRVFRAKQMYQLGRWSVHPDSAMFAHVLSGASELRLRVRDP
jgi:peptidoglycan/xylan/chitin deacetylase (PgdA/CDA1 family)